MNTHQETKGEYMEMEREMGVFQIRNKVNQKIYVGCSDDLNAAWESHKSRLDAGIHPNGGLQSDYHKMGPDNFDFEVIEQISPEKSNTPEIESDLNELESSILEKLQPYDDHGYNKKHD